MMNRIVDTVHANLQSLEDAEEEALETFNGVKANLDATIRELGTLFVRLQTHIDDMNSCVLEEDIVRTAASEKQRRNQEMLDTCNTMCDSFAHEYEIASEGRNEERDLLRLIKQMAEERMVRYRDAEENHTSSTLDAVEEFGGIHYEHDAYEATSDEWQ
jgi:hypothetical protein